MKSQEQKVLDMYSKSCVKYVQTIRSFRLSTNKQPYKATFKNRFIFDSNLTTKAKMEVQMTYIYVFTIV